jgi:glycosyltransferase involved in cell wall biosynthesis
MDLAMNRVNLENSLRNQLGVMGILKIKPCSNQSSDPMRIIALEKYPSSLRGGQELSLLDVCRGLANKGHDLTLLYADRGNLLPQYQAFCDRTMYVPSFGLSRQMLWQAPLQQPIALSRLWGLLRQNSPTLLYCNQIYDIPAPALLGSLTQTPLVCHLRLPPPQSLDRLRQMALSRVYRFITVSQSTRRQWIDFGIPAEKITCIYNGVDIDRFTIAPTLDQPESLRHCLNLPETAQVIAYTGRLDRRKGVEILLEAMAKLHPTHPNLHLILAGKALLDGPSYQATLEQKTIELGLNDRVHFLGHLTDPRSLYHIAELTVSPSIWAEPFGKVIVESMACGTPVVASRMGGIPEILTQELAQGLCEPNNSGDLAETLDRLLNWRETQPNLGKISRQHICQNFALSSVIDQIESEFLVILDSYKLDSHKLDSHKLDPHKLARISRT